jgi:hypothetical protein
MALFIVLTSFLDALPGEVSRDYNEVLGCIINPVLTSSVSLPVSVFR